MSFLLWHVLYIAGTFLAIQVVLSVFVLGTTLIDNILVSRMRKGARR